jgi:hypothetical protein
MRVLRLVAGWVPLLVVVWAAGTAAADSSGWISWRTVAHVEEGLSGISCPSSSLCVASGANGGVATSTDPGSTRGSWDLANVDGGNRLTAVACLTARTCAVVDSVGQILLSTAPADGSASWGGTTVPGDTRSLSCPTAAFCAAGAGGYVYVTSDPAGGSSGWVPAAGGDQGPECGKYGGTSGCSTASVVVSCPSASFCAAGDSYGRAFSSTDPLGGSPAWLGEAPGAGEYDSLSCPSGSLCVGSCPPGVGLNGAECGGNSYDAGTIVSWNPGMWQASPGLVRFTQISPQQLIGVWCQTDALCFATDGNLLYSTVSPAGGPSSWGTIAHETSVAAVACPSATRCVAVTSHGTIVLGSPAPNKHQISSLLRQAIVPPRPLRSIALLKHSGYSFVFNAPTAGRVQISWYERRHSGQRKTILVARVTHRYTNAGTNTLKLTLTPAGRRTLGTSPRKRLLINAAFTGREVVATTKRAITLR